MDEKQQIIFKETRLRNLRRTHSKLKEHAELTEEAQSIKKEIELLEDELGIEPEEEVAMT